MKLNMISYGNDRFNNKIYTNKKIKTICELKKFIM